MAAQNPLHSPFFVRRTFTFFLLLGTPASRCIASENSLRCCCLRLCFPPDYQPLSNRCASNLFAIRQVEPHQRFPARSASANTGQGPPVLLSKKFAKTGRLFEASNLPASAVLILKHSLFAPVFSLYFCENKCYFAGQISA